MKKQFTVLCVATAVIMTGVTGGQSTATGSGPLGSVKISYTGAPSSRSRLFALALHLL